MNKEMKIAELNNELAQWNEQYNKNCDMFARYDNIELRNNILCFNRLINIYISKIKSSIRYYENQ